MAAITSTKIYSGTLREIYATDNPVDGTDTCTILTDINLPFDAMLSLTKVNVYISTAAIVNAPVPTVAVTKDGTTHNLKIVLSNTAVGGNTYLAIVEAYVYHTRIAYPDLAHINTPLAKIYQVNSAQIVSPVP